MISAFLLAVGLTFVPADKESPDKSSFAAVTSKKFVPTPPGPPPPFHADDYVRYRGTGGATMTGSPTVTVASGTTYTCTAGKSVALYPDTPYTRWMIQNFLYFISRTNTWREPAVLAGAPDYLNFDARDTIVRNGNCMGGTFEVRNLPEGSYLALAEIRIEGSESMVNTSVENGNGPAGPETIFHNQYTSTGVDLDGFYLVGATSYRVARPSGTYTILNDSWLVAAHLSPGR